MRIDLNLYKQKPIFKGYDAIPLKTLHISSEWGKIEDELSEICKKENIELKPSKFNASFSQDLLLILNNNNKTSAIIEEGAGIMEPYLKEMEEHYGMPVEISVLGDNSDGYIAGGNFYLGKKPNGEKFMLVGSMEQILNDKKAIAKRFDVKEENIHFIQQQDYHLDMSIRPIGHPYVLVNNPELALKNENKVKNIKTKSKPRLEEGNFKMQAYKKCMEQLRNNGFTPITIGAVYSGNGGDINFMNAIVNKHKDGSISYITNSSKCNNSYISKYQKLFEKDLRRKLEELRAQGENAPELREIYFVEGENYGENNEIMENLAGGSGGVHCMTSEEPNFEAWV